VLTYTELGIQSNTEDYLRNHGFLHTEVGWICMVFCKMQASYAWT